MIDIVERDNLKLNIDHNDYLNFIADDAISVNKWYGISVQKEGHNHRVGDADLYRFMEKAFVNILELEYDASNWIVMHEYRDFEWFTNKIESDGFPVLASIFKIGETGVAVGGKEDLLKLSGDIVRYSSQLSRSDINCIHDSSELIIKLNSHATVDIVTTSLLSLERYKEKIRGIKGINIVHYNRHQ